jgi:hypothetical protein
VTFRCVPSNIDTPLELFVHRDKLPTSADYIWRSRFVRDAQTIVLGNDDFRFTAGTYFARVHTSAPKVRHDSISSCSSTTVARKFSLADEYSDSALKMIAIASTGRFSTTLLLLRRAAHDEDIRTRKRSVSCNASHFPVILTIQRTPRAGRGPRGGCLPAVGNG